MLQLVTKIASVAGVRSEIAADSDTKLQYYCAAQC